MHVCHRLVGAKSSESRACDDAPHRLLRGVMRCPGFAACDAHQPSAEPGPRPACRAVPTLERAESDTSDLTARIESGWPPCTRHRQASSRARVHVCAWRSPLTSHRSGFASRLHTFTTALYSAPFGWCFMAAYRSDCTLCM
eukprot:355524-Chlamydomonas_euryale.AAC.39